MRNHLQIFGKTVLLSLFMAWSSTDAEAQVPEMVASPDGSIHISVGVATNPSGLEELRFSVQMDGHAVVQQGGFALEFKDAPSFGSGVAMTNVSRRTFDETWERYWGKRSHVRNHYNELAVTLTETNAEGRRVDLIFRAYDDGIAFRYVLPESWGDFALSAERTSIQFPGNPSVWAANFRTEDWSGDMGGFVSHQEAEFPRMRLSELDSREVYGCPMLVQLGPDLWTAVTEADLTDWAGMYFSPAASFEGSLTSALSPRPDELNVVVRSTAPRSSPWRVFMLGRRPGDLIESDLIQNLNDPPDGDFSWVEPGKSAWDRWWSNGYGPEQDFQVGINTASMKYFIDLAAEMGWEYQLVDYYWYDPPFIGNSWVPNLAADITTPDPNLDIEDVIRYAHSKGVDIILWLHWANADQQMEKAFPLYEKWGVKGIKIDFMVRDDQEMVNYYHRTVKKAAEHHLFVDFHGAYKPTGWSRTYPNLITREGVLGNEYSKWSDRITPEHTVTIPFTRGLLGEMDFTPGGFRNRTLETFETENPAPNVMGTRVNQLAMFVVFESALQVVPDSPYNYRSSPAGTDFLKIVPTTWDETRVVDGFPGQFITIARQSGDAWYLASMTNWRPRTLEISLDFLGTGTYQAEIWADAYEAADFPDRLMKKSVTVTAGDTLSAVLAPGGGHIVRFTPVQ